MFSMKHDTVLSAPVSLFRTQPKNGAHGFHSQAIIQSILNASEVIRKLGNTSNSRLPDGQVTCRSIKIKEERPRRGDGQQQVHKLR